LLHFLLANFDLSIGLGSGIFGADAVADGADGAAIAAIAAVATTGVGAGDNG